MTPFCTRHMHKVLLLNVQYPEDQAFRIQYPISWRLWNQISNIPEAYESNIQYSNIPCCDLMAWTLPYQRLVGVALPCLYTAVCTSAFYSNNEQDTTEKQYLTS